MPYTFHVYANLMRSSGFQAAFYKTGIPQILKNPKVRNCLFSMYPIDSLLFSIFLIPPYGRVNRSFRFFKMTFTYRMIPSCNTVFLKLLGQCFMTKVIFTNQKQAGGIFIDAMYNPRPVNTVNGRKGISRIGQYRIYKRTRKMSRCRMHHHSARFINNKKIVVLINDRKRNLFRPDIQGFRLLLR